MGRRFLLLWSLGVVSTALALPYIFALQRDVLATVPLSLSQLSPLIVGQTALLLAIAVFFGLKLAERIHLQPLVVFDTGLSRAVLLRIARLAVPVGILVALCIKVGDYFFLQKLPQLALAVQDIPAWKTLLVAPYGGVVEELLLRLFVVSLFAWLLSVLFRVKNVVENSRAMWTAIVLAAILFGLGHLPATATLVELTPLVVLRAILLNGIGGLAFGWLYWKKGLVYAIVAHFTTDIVLHTLLPLVL